MREVFINITTRIVINADDSVDINEVLDELDYNFISQTDGAVITDTEIIDTEVIDSK